MGTMRVRDAVEADASAMASIANAPTDVMRNLVHDRTVRVAVDEAAATDPNADAREIDDEAILGFVSFDAKEGVVHVTQLDGTEAACERLLGEPIRFAEGEGMVVELLAPDESDAVRTAAEAVGFADRGAGPRFDGTGTTRYRLEP